MWFVWRAAQCCQWLLVKVSPCSCFIGQSSLLLLSNHPQFESSRELMRNKARIAGPRSVVIQTHNQNHTYSLFNHKILMRFLPSFILVYIVWSCSQSRDGFFSPKGLGSMTHHGCRWPEPRTNQNRSRRLTRCHCFDMKGISVGWEKSLLHTNLVYLNVLETIVKTIVPLCTNQE